MEPVVFLAALWRTTTDNDGESKVTFTVPQSELGRVALLSMNTNALLRVEVSLAPEQSS